MVFLARFSVVLRQKQQFTKDLSVNALSKSIKNKDVVIVTTTCSPTLDNARSQLAFKTCLAARDHGYTIILIDDNSCSEFKTYARKTGARVIGQARKGMGASRRQAIKAGLATGAKVIIWMEPEKHTLIPLLEPCIIPVLTKNADAVIPRRRELDGYPLYQQFSEHRGNWELGNITGRPDLDLFCGPRIMSTEAALMMWRYTGFCGQNRYGDNWEILFVPVLWWIKNNLRMESVLVNYIHPPPQFLEDDPAMRAKRDKQRTCIVDAMMREAKRLGITGL